MQKFSLIMAVLFLGATINAQNLTHENGGYEKTRKINGKKFRVMYYEYQINKTPEEVWDEVAGNFVNVGKIVKAVDESHCESGDVTEGLGAARYCDINFSGKSVKIKEKITDWKVSDNRKEYTYDVYESQGFPAKVYNTWVVRKGTDGQTYLGNTFIFRAKPSFMTGMMARKLKKLGALRNAVLSYKHYLETGEKKADPEIFKNLYPEV